MNVKEFKSRLAEQRAEILKTFHVKKIGIFGSVLRNEQRKRSDVDVLVEFEKGHKDFFNYMRLKFYLEASLGRRVDLVIKDAVKPRLKERVLAEVVYV